MKPIVFDGFALLALFFEEKGGAKVLDILTQLSQQSEKGWMSAINYGEVYYMMVRKRNGLFAKAALEDMERFPITIVPPSQPDCMAAARLKSLYRLSYADAFAAALALSLRTDLITGDREFRELESTEGLSVTYLSK